MAEQPTIFITDPTAEVARLASALRAAGYQVADLPLSTLASRVAAQTPSLVLLDADTEGALEAVSHLRQGPEGEGIEILLVGAPGKTLRDTADAVVAGANGFLSRPVDPQLALRKILALVPADPDEPISASRQPRTARPAQLHQRPSDPPSRGRPPSDPPPEPEAWMPRGAPSPVLSDELRLALQRAEERVEASLRNSSDPPHRPPSPDLIVPVPAHLLEALDEPLLHDDRGSWASVTPQPFTSQTPLAPPVEETSAGGGAPDSSFPQNNDASTRIERLVTRSPSEPPEQLSFNLPLLPSSLPPATYSSLPPSQGQAALVLTGRGPQPEPLTVAEGPDSRPPRPLPTEAPSPLPPLAQPLAPSPWSLAPDTPSSPPTAPPPARLRASTLAAAAPAQPLPPAPPTTPPAAAPAPRPSPPPPPPPPVEPAPAPRQMPAPVVLQEGDPLRLLAGAVAERFSGVLCFDAQGGLRRIVLRDGDLVTVGSSIDGESLVAYLEQRGDLPKDLAKKLQGRLPPFGRHAGAALVAHGHLSQDRLWETLRGHAEWLAGRVLGLSSGTCVYEAEASGRFRSEPSVFGGSTGAEVLVEILRRVVTTGDALRLLGGSKARLAEGKRPLLLEECALPPAEQRLIERSKGLTVGELLEGTEAQDMAAVLVALVALGAIEMLSAVAAEPTAPPPHDDLDDEALRARVRARMALVEEGDYFAVLGVPRGATPYEIKRAYLDLRRSFEPSRVLSPQTADLLEALRTIIEILDEAYEVLRDTVRRERYLRAIQARPPEDEDHA